MDARNTQVRNPVWKGLLLLLIYVPAWLIYTLTVSLYKNMKKAKVYAFNPEEKKKIKRDVESEKLVTLMNERLHRVERLVYGIYEDPEYAKSDRGKSDLKELRQETQ